MAEVSRWRPDARFAERGFCHAWNSRVAEGNGEDVANTRFVETPLAAARITDCRLWWFDVPEWFTTAEDLYRRLVSG